MFFISAAELNTRSEKIHESPPSNDATALRIGSNDLNPISDLSYNGRGAGRAKSKIGSSTKMLN